MKAALIVLALASALAGCSTARHTTGEGSAFPRDAYQDLARDLQPDPSRDRSHYWAVRDFMQPRGLFQ